MGRPGRSLKNDGRFQVRIRGRASGFYLGSYLPYQRCRLSIPNANEEECAGKPNDPRENATGGGLDRAGLGVRAVADGVLERGLRAAIKPLRNPLHRPPRGAYCCSLQESNGRRCAGCSAATGLPSPPIIRRPDAGSLEPKRGVEPCSPSKVHQFTTDYGKPSVDENNQASLCHRCSFGRPHRRPSSSSQSTGHVSYPVIPDPSSSTRQVEGDRGR
jgi:hypothetical protein